MDAYTVGMDSYLIKNISIIFTNIKNKLFVFDSLDIDKSNKNKRKQLNNEEDEDNQDNQDFLKNKQIINKFYSMCEGNDIKKIDSYYLKHKKIINSYSFFDCYKDYDINDINVIRWLFDQAILILTRDLFCKFLNLGRLDILKYLYTLGSFSLLSLDISKIKLSDEIKLWLADVVKDEIKFKDFLSDFKNNNNNFDVRNHQDNVVKKQLGRGNNIFNILKNDLSVEQLNFLCLNLNVERNKFIDGFHHHLFNLNFVMINRFYDWLYSIYGEQIMSNILKAKHIKILFEYFLKSGNFNNLKNLDLYKIYDKDKMMYRGLILMACIMGNEEYICWWSYNNNYLLDSFKIPLLIECINKCFDCGKINVVLLLLSKIRIKYILVSFNEKFNLKICIANQYNYQFDLSNYSPNMFLYRILGMLFAINSDKVYTILNIKRKFVNSDNDCCLICLDQPGNLLMLGCGHFTCLSCLLIWFSSVGVNKNNNNCVYCSKNVIWSDARKLIC